MVRSAPVHEAFTALGLLVGGLVALGDARRSGRTEPGMAWVVTGILVGGAAGARIAPLLRYLGEVDQATIAGALVHSGKSILGGLSGAYLGAVGARRLAGITRPTGDVFVRGVAAGLAVGRVGCLLTEPLGQATSVPWAVQGMHPAMLYEIAFQLVAFAVLTRASGAGRPEGELFRAYLLAYAVFRFGLEFVRGTLVVAGGLTGSQLFLLPSIALVGWSLLRRPAARLEVA